VSEGIHTHTHTHTHTRSGACRKVVAVEGRPNRRKHLPIKPYQVRSLRFQCPSFVAVALVVVVVEPDSTRRRLDVKLLLGTTSCLVKRVACRCGESLEFLSKVTSGLVIVRVRLEGSGHYYY
jgi:hypothetical protein